MLYVRNLAPRGAVDTLRGRSSRPCRIRYFLVWEAKAHRRCCLSMSFYTEVLANQLPCLGGIRTFISETIILSSPHPPVKSLDCDSKVGTGVLVVRSKLAIVEFEGCCFKVLVGRSGVGGGCFHRERETCQEKTAIAPSAILSLLV